jgi:hypothetical protein
MKKQETFAQMSARIKGEIRRDEIDEGVVPKRHHRYCEMCDVWMRVRTCKACGMATVAADR